MKVCVFTPWIRPGGGLSALQQILHALGETPGLTTTVVTGAPDTSEALQPLIARHTPLSERRFHPGASPAARYALAKLAAPAVTRGVDQVLTINYWVPTPSPLTVYHMNLLNFQSGDADSMGWRIRRLDARTACRRAEQNLFESEFVRDVARDQAGSIRGDGLLYLGIRSDFTRWIGQTGDQPRGRLALITNAEPYKRDELAFRVLARLVEREPAVPWHLRLIGGPPGQGAGGLERRAEEFGVADRVAVLGRLPASAVAGELRSARVLLAPSDIESFFMVAVEAMACGCPAVLRDVSSARESVGEAGAVCGPDDVEGMVEAVLRVEQPGAARQDAVEKGWQWAERFSPERFGAALRRELGVGASP